MTKEEVRIRVDRINRTLECKLTADELKQCSKTLAESVRKKTQIEDALATFKAQKKSEVTAIDAEISLQSGLINSEKEYRMIDCESRINYATGRKTVTRMDTGEIISDEPLSKEEKQMELDV